MHHHQLESRVVCGGEGEEEARGPSKVAQGGDLARLFVNPTKI